MDRVAWYWQQRNKNRENSTMSVSPVVQLVKNLRAMQERPGFDPWVGKIPWIKEQLPTPVF